MIDMSPRAIADRLRDGAQRSDLRTEHRLHYNLDMMSAGISHRLLHIEALLRFCLQLVGIGDRNGLGRVK